jgi:hypothetical protein
MQLLIDTIGEATLYEWGRVRAVPHFAFYTLAFAFN